MTKPSPALVIPMRRIVRTGLIALAVVPVLTAIAYGIWGADVAWGIAMGGGIPLAFFGLTAAVALRTAGASAEKLGAIVLGSWLVKIVVLIAVLAWLKDQHFYHRGAFFAALLIATFGMLILEAMITLKTKVPYVDPA